MSHRILNVASAQIAVGDVVLTFPTSSSDRVFTGYGIPDREVVIECHRDPADGTVYVKTHNAAEFLSPYDHVQLDCLLTFGRNFNNGDLNE